MKEKIMSLLQFTIVAILCFSCHVLSIGRYQPSITQLLRCEDEGTNEISFSNTRLTKVSRNTFSYLSNLTLAITLDDNISVISEVIAWGNGGWRPAYFTQDMPHFCSGCKKLVPSWFHELIKNTGKDDCPIPPGTYEINAYNFSYIDFTFSLAASGKYKLINSFHKQDILVGCIGMVLDIITKRKPTKKRN